MKDPNIETKVVHSESKPAWNVVGTNIGKKYKIARVPYFTGSTEEVDKINRIEAKNIADFISYCFNNSKKILP